MPNGNKAKKRKNSKSPTVRKTAKTTKLIDTRKATSQTPTSSSSVQDSSQAPSLPQTQLPSLLNGAGKQVKPLFLTANIQVVKNVLQNIQFSSRPLIKVRNSNSTQVLCATSEDKKNVIDKLRSQHIAYHTFTDPADKPSYFLMKGFFDDSCENILATLKSCNVPATKVSYFIRNNDYVIYLVHFDKSVTLNVLNHSHKIVDGIVIRWEILMKSNKKITQCFRCQQWGHSSFNCGQVQRCVKCAESHEPGACLRTSREGDPKCCNCNGAHTSNHRGCPIYLKHIEKRKIVQKKNINVPVRPVDFTSSSQFPSLGNHSAPVISNSSSNNVSFAQSLKVSNTNSSVVSKLQQAQNKFISLPNINETVNLFVSMVDELSSCVDQSAQLLVFMKYCTPIRSNNGS
jgi:hypothetical protein